MDRANRTNIPRIITLRWLTHQLMSRAYALLMASNPLLMGRKRALWNLLWWGFITNMREHIIGTKVKAPVVDTTIMIETIQPNCLNITPVVPLIIVKGRNTANMVSVEAITDSCTSWVACTAASFGLEPRSICVVMFSNTTMASSTTIPMAMVSDDMEMIFSVLPVA